ncbi:4-hydroxy-tetrahydrodipicolinate reductase [Nocardia kruczakiae]|uniref:4-hydroxy-tetrahydrodipicolinate reductase n=1 Tax=Nocardia kruczakiae TaxID=261477 RepID=A0ABU1XBU9_9NOCA|nr:dihydrodipicolinate reductase C-terminal domain-containing protein [Nocardia kruczakiae]MDR7168014.1 4-hydroxy-tetrahydrodipicolinate reductase [Nocardia kruczakiae]
MVVNTVVVNTVAVVGSTGRLGSAVARECARRGLPIVAEVWSGGRRIGAERPDVVVDASHPAALDDTAELCRRTGSPLLYCVSNPGGERLRLLRDLSAEIPVALATNLSPLHWIQVRTAALAAQLAGAITDDAETMIVDRHPATKRDAPSATARLLRETMGGHADITSVRYGPMVSDHHIVFTAGPETLELNHSVRDIRAAALGALRLAGELVGLPAGWFTAAQLYDRIAERSAGESSPDPSVDSSHIPTRSR